MGWDDRGEMASSVSSSRTASVHNVHEEGMLFERWTWMLVDARVTGEDEEDRGQNRRGTRCHTV